MTNVVESRLGKTGTRLAIRGIQVAQAAVEIPIIQEGAKQLNELNNHSSSALLELSGLLLLTYVNYILFFAGQRKAEELR